MPRRLPLPMHFRDIKSGVADKTKLRRNARQYLLTLLGFDSATQPLTTTAGVHGSVRFEICREFEAGL
jgi:hypothetical protein